MLIPPVLLHHASFKTRQTCQPNGCNMGQRSDLPGGRRIPIIILEDGNRNTVWSRPVCSPQWQKIGNARPSMTPFEIYWILNRANWRWGLFQPGQPFRSLTLTRMPHDRKDCVRLGG